MLKTRPGSPSSLPFTPLPRSRDRGKLAVHNRDMSFQWTDAELRERSIFPKGLTYSECMASVADMPCFRSTKCAFPRPLKGQYVVINYDYAFRETFPDPKSAADPQAARLLAIRRECRGIIFDVESGGLLVRRFHKFFNINELDECTSDKIDIRRPHWLLEKADGLVTPLLVDGKLVYGTKMGATGITSDVQTFVDARPQFRYNDLSAKAFALGWTPLFEFCAASNQVVLEYPEDHLFLTAVRHNASGVYLHWPELKEFAALYNVPTVSESPLKMGNDYTTVVELLDKVKAIDHVEGYVIVFENGEMYKLKTNWYIERSKRQNANFSHQEKDLFALILDGKLDDLGDAIGDHRRLTLEEFGKNLIDAIRKSAVKVDAWVADAKAQSLSKKEFVARMMKRSKEADADTILAKHVSLVLSAFDLADGVGSFKMLCAHVRTNCSTATKLAQVRDSLCGGVSIKL